ncbi:histidine phosphatase family protein [Curvibacter sp. PAE-UM]|uniref:histidine phosphatase family protein n=1 Tax=Curvibacter sp. PAE-UM TaxID=1714344 RepID=UPI00070A7F86|nr:histidine phosphatase family protein [Curvibacter sp. PAE-UM]KRH99199.1 phosphoglycerate kinase [Curvibacter sp. PAE-UM]
MTELILIRHGETDWNRELRFQGQLDVPLNATGLEQAQRVAARLAQESMQQLVSSDLQRALQTAQAVAGRCAQPLDPVLDAALREQHFGVVEGLRVPDIQQQHPQAWDQWVRFEADFAFEGGESTRAFHARVLAALRALARRHPEQTLAVVTHGGVLDMVYRSALGLALSGPRVSDIPNAGINRVRLLGEAVEIIDWADTRHLADLPPQPVYDQQRLARERAEAARVVAPEADPA